MELVQCHCTICFFCYSRVWKKHAFSYEPNVEHPCVALCESCPVVQGLCASSEVVLKNMLATSNQRTCAAKWGKTALGRDKQQRHQTEICTLNAFKIIYHNSFWNFQEFICTQTLAHSKTLIYFAQEIVNIALIASNSTQIDATECMFSFSHTSLLFFLYITPFFKFHGIMDSGLTCQNNWLQIFRIQNSRIYSLKSKHVQGRKDLIIENKKSDIHGGKSGYLKPFLDKIQPF